ncbi:MAG: hypothetical protein HYY24_20495 [Verrucomicrobia bacterium]|nr:hypothetical protein [Verrucomicrobiota bacterium]
MALSLGAEGVSHLEGGQWEASVNYRYLYADEGYIGDRIDPTYKRTIGAQLTLHSIDVQATYAFNPRFSATLTIPFFSGEIASYRDHENDGIHRHTVSAGGLGDVRLVGNVWLLDPDKHKDGNISLGIGVKAPTGDEAATDTFHKTTGLETRPVDIAIQPSDGGWGIVLELIGYQKIIDRLYGYVAGSYLINPREQNSAYTTIPIYGAVRNLSVPDQYLGRVGITYAIWPEKGLSLSFGGRIDGIPARDLIGGSEGFRRPGFSVYVEPGVSWARGKNTFNLFTPVLVDANRERNIYDDRFGGHGPGAFADYVIIASFTRRL